MKILYYNWVPFDDNARRGGGVTVYLNDLISKMSLDNQLQCSFFSSGLKYTFDNKLRIEETKNCFSNRVKSFQIINSPVHAPACMQFSNLDIYLNDTTLLNLLESFWVEQGGFDVVHFNSLEGLSLSVLKLKELHPEAKFYYSLHNYFLFCPQVNLWTSTGMNCYCHSQFPYCSRCVVTSDSKIERLAASAKALLGTRRNIQNTELYKILKIVANKIRYFSIEKRMSELAANCIADDLGGVFVKYRTQNLDAANCYFDAIFAVSQRVADIAQSFGIRTDKLFVDYIGTEVASNCRIPKEVPEKYLCVGYLGYARADKGFNVLLDALSSLPSHASSKLDILLAAKCDTQEIYDKYKLQTDLMMERFHSLRFKNGYSKSEQHDLLEQIDLGVVPVLWEDNLPQVAIEYIAFGIPIITSDCGGAKELCTNIDFIYNGNDIHALAKKLEEFTEVPKKLSLFWDDMPKLTTMEEHIQNLKVYYAN